MIAPVTAEYAAILGIFLMLVGINVTVHRTRLKVPLGDGGNEIMARMVRIHGNASEYIPIALILMFFAEADGAGRPLVHVAGVVLVVARLLHAYGLWQSNLPNFGRGVGQSLTWLVIVGLAVVNLWLVV